MSLADRNKVKLVFVLAERETVIADSFVVVLPRESSSGRLLRDPLVDRLLDDRFESFSEADAAVRRVFKKAKVELVRPA